MRNFRIDIWLAVADEFVLFDFNHSEKIGEWAREKPGEKFASDYQEEGDRDDAAEETEQETGQRDESQDQ